MRREERPINFPGAGDEGTPCMVNDFEGGWIGLDGTWTGTVDVEGLISTQQEGFETWATIASAVAQGGTVIEVKTPFAQVRINGTNMSAPEGVAVFVGFNTRTR